MEPEVPTLISDSFPNRKTPYWMSMLLLLGFILLLFGAFIGFARAGTCTTICTPTAAGGQFCTSTCD